MVNCTKCTPKKRKAFLDVLSAGYSVHRAAAAADVCRRTVYNWREADKQFATEWDAAYEAGTDTLEDALHDRATDKDTTAAIFLLKGRRPEKYRERTDQRVTGDVTVILKQYDPNASNAAE